jgi:ribosomal protein S18 acetylase RimI-like enzyme
VTIKRATSNDIPTIRAIARITWPDAYFPSILDQGQLEYMLDMLYSPSALETAMNNKGQLFMIASDDDGPGAFAGFTPHHREGTTHLNKLYALPSWQGRGAGRILLERVLQEAATSGDHSIELNVNKRNVAIGFYEHMGFRVLREEVIDIGSGYVMDDYVMGRPLAAPK